MASDGTRPAAHRLTAAFLTLGLGAASFACPLQLRPLATAVHSAFAGPHEQAVPAALLSRPPQPLDEPWSGARISDGTERSDAAQLAAESRASEVREQPGIHVPEVHTLIVALLGGVFLMRRRD